MNFNGTVTVDAHIKSIGVDGGILTNVIVVNVVVQSTNEIREIFTSAEIIPLTITISGTKKFLFSL